MEFASGISIIVATEGRSNLTAGLLKELLVVRKPFVHPTEVLVIDSSIGAERVEIASACENSDAILIDGPVSVRSKRNIGIKRACYSVLLFLDSDCLPSTSLLEKHWENYVKDPAQKIGGVLGRLQFFGKETFSWQIIKDSSLVQHFSIAAQSRTVRWGATANLSIRHDVFNDIGLFDESFPFKLGGDDLDMTYRMTCAGWELLCEPDALVFHSRSTWSSVRSVLSRALRWGKMEYYLYCKHSNLRSPSTPSIWGWLIFVMVYAIILSLLQSSVRYLALPAVWFFLSLILFSIWTTMASGDKRNLGIKKFFQDFLTAFPELTYQLGSTLEFVKHGDLRFLHSRVLLNHQGIEGYWTSDAWNIWSNLLALLICQTAFWIWM